MAASADWIRRAFVAASVAWAGALPAAALVASQAQPSMGAYAFAAIVYATGAVVCHQLPERSFFLFGRQLPVCARCLGIYVGGAVAAVIISVMRLRSATRAALPMVLAASVPVAATLVFEWTTGVTPGNWIRAGSGVVLGAAIARVVLYEVD